MLGVHQGHDQIGCLQIGHGALLRGSLTVLNNKAALLESFEREWRERTNIVYPALDGERARSCHPTQSGAERMVVEKLFGKATAVIVAGAEKKDCSHHRRNNLWLLRHTTGHAGAFSAFFFL
jgi:hypothetical protein